MQTGRPSEFDLHPRLVSVIGSGPSLKGQDLSSTREAGFVIAVNDAWRQLTFAPDVVVTIDTLRLRERFYDCPHKVIAAIPERYGTAAADMHCDRIPAPRWLHYMRRAQGGGMSSDETVLNAGGNSGFGALNFAYHMRPRKIALFGFDMAEMANHWHGRRPINVSVMSERTRLRCIESFAIAAAHIREAGIAVANCNPNSAITAFPLMTHERGIQWSLT